MLHVLECRHRHRARSCSSRGFLRFGHTAALVGLDVGYDLVYLWLPSADLAVARVADRVRMGGHPRPEETIRRRYHAGLRNFFRAVYAACHEVANAR